MPLLLMFCMVAAASATPITRPIHFPGNGPALIRFYTGGHVDPAGKGIAVVDSAGKPVPYELIRNDPAGETLIAVDPAGRGLNLTLQYDRFPSRLCERAEAVPVSLLLRVYPLGRRVMPTNVDEAFRNIDASHPQGAVLARRVDLGYNPFGDSRWLAIEFTGVLHARGNPEQIFTASGGPDRLEIDGKTVLQHDAARTIRKGEDVAAGAVKLNLSRGDHPFRYRTVQGQGPMLAMIGHVRGRRVLPLDSAFFRHDSPATLGPAAGGSVGFDAQPMDQIANGDFNFIRVHFAAIAPAPAGRTYRWDFGDGSTQTGPDAQHVYVTAAAAGPVVLPVPVKLQLLKDTRVVGTAEARINAPVDGHYQTAGDIGLVAEYADLFNAPTYTRPSPEVLGAMWGLVAITEQPKLEAKVAGLLLSHGGPPPTLADESRYAFATAVARDHPQEAADLFGKLSRGRDGWLAARAAAEQMDLLIYRLNRPDRVEAMLRSDMSGRTGRERALLMSRLGDVFRFKGDLKQAEADYRQASRISMKPGLDARKAAVLEQAHRETALAYLAQHRYPALREELFAWEAQFPLAKLGGDLPLIAARYFQAIGNDPRAAVEVRTLLKTNPLTPARPELLFRLGESLKNLGQTAEAAKAFDELTTKYPNSPFAEQAKKLR